MMAKRGPRNRTFSRFFSDRGMVHRELMRRVAAREQMSPALKGQLETNAPGFL